MQFFTKESNRFTSLYEHSSNANPACITLKLEGLLKIRKLQQWYLRELQLESIKSLLLCWSPSKRHTILCQPVERCCNGAEIPLETPVKTCKTKKTSNLRDHSRKWLACDGNNICRVHLNALQCNNITKKRHTIGGKRCTSQVYQINAQRARY
jgi:hypothetical protein